jgi:RHS repeat-associated protein
MLIPNRHESSDKYRYGFQGQEKDDEIKGEGNSINYKFRIHDPRVGRFFAVDPLTKKYPWYTPYSFSGNKVIAWGELEGLEEYYAADGKFIAQLGDDTSIRVANKEMNRDVVALMVSQANNADTPKNVVSAISGYLSDNSYSTFSSHQKAAEHFGDKYSGASMVKGILGLGTEAGAVISELKLSKGGLDAGNCFILSKVVWGDPINRINGQIANASVDLGDLYNDSGTPGNIVADVHTHGFGGQSGSNFFSKGLEAGLFSEGDIPANKMRGTIGYLVTASGVLKSFDPNTLEIKTVSRNMPYNPNLEQPKDRDSKSERKKPAIAKPANSKAADWSGDKPKIYEDQ